MKGQSFDQRFEEWAMAHPFIGGPLVSLIPANIAWQVVGPWLAVIVFLGFASAICVLALRARREDEQQG